jgi:alpha-tubulin suppressor-like RCC1 family protein
LIKSWTVMGFVSLAAVGCGKGKETRNETKQEPTGTERTGANKPLVAGARKVVKIAAGDGAACAVMDNGRVRCWGKNDGGERGTAPSRDDAATPVEVPGVANAVDIVMGGDSGSSGDIACAISKAKDVTCWGGSQMFPTPDTKPDPRAFPELKGVISLALGGGTAYAVKPDGTVWGWGGSAFNALADGTQSSGPDRPLTQIPGLTGATQVAAGQNHGCALLGDGTVSCWGYPSKQQPPTVVAGLAGVTAIFGETQRDRTCATTTDSTQCWDGEGTLQPIATLATVIKIAGRNHMCALDSIGAVSCWGDNSMGQLGGSGTSSTPGKVEGLGTAIDIAVGHAFTCAALEDGTASCWGYNQRGQLGDGTLTDRKVPTTVAGIGAVTLLPAKTGLDAVQEGPTPTVWDGMPAACKNGPIAVVTPSYEGKAFTVKGAKAASQLGGKTVTVDLADHLFHTSWGAPRGTQGRLALRLAKFEIRGDKREPVNVDVGEYKLGTQDARLVSPSLVTKTGTASLITIGLKGIDTGRVTISHLDDKWVCGELALAAEGSSVKGPFAAPIMIK